MFTWCKKHRKLLIILGAGLLVATAVSIAAIACAPSLVVMPAFLWISMKLSVAVGASVTSKIVVGSMFAGAALIGASIASGVTAAVLAIGKFFKRPQISEKSASIEIEDDKPMVVLENKSKEKNEVVPFLRAKPTSDGLQKHGKFSTFFINSRAAVTTPSDQPSHLGVHRYSRL